MNFSIAHLPWGSGNDVSHALGWGNKNILIEEFPKVHFHIIHHLSLPHAVQHEWTAALKVLHCSAVLIQRPFMLCR